MFSINRQFEYFDFSGMYREQFISLYFKLIRMKSPPKKVCATNTDKK